MANTYFKMLNNSIKEEFTENIISDIQVELHHNSKILSENIFDAIKDVSENRVQEFDINSLLKYYVLNQIIKENKNRIKPEETFESTENPNIKKDKNNKYYRVINNECVLAKDIETVNPDGSYITTETRLTSSFKTLKTYNTKDQILSIQVIDSNGNVANKFDSIEILGMKKIYTQKFKYSGYSGESSDIIASLLNKLYTPKETDNYMDKSCNFYRWSELKKCFTRNFTAESKSPLLTDYEFSNSIVIQKEYTGVR